MSKLSDAINATLTNNVSAGRDLGFNYTSIEIRIAAYQDDRFQMAKLIGELESQMFSV